MCVCCDLYNFAVKLIPTIGKAYVCLSESATGILVVPLFTTQPWFTRLFGNLTSEPLLLPKSHTCLYFYYRPPHTPNFRLIAFHVSGKGIDKK